MSEKKPPQTPFDLNAVFEVDDYMAVYSDDLTDERSDAEVASLGDLLELDYSHPSQKGNALIADLLMEAELFGSPSATPPALEASPTS